MEAVVKWTDGVQFVGESGSGHCIVMDASGKAPRPMEMLLMGAGGCASYDVIGILQKARQKVRDCRVELSATRADAVPAVFTHIDMHFIVSGVGIKDSHVARAVALSAEKYCSASIMLGAAGVEITHRYTLINED